MAKNRRNNWRTTVSGTRILYDGDKRVGHVRNAGDKVWRMEYYPTGEVADADSLVGAKALLEGRSEGFHS